VTIHVADDRGYPLDRVEVRVVSLDLAEPIRHTLFTGDAGEAELQGAMGLPLRITLVRPGKAPQVEAIESAPAKLAFTLVVVGTLALAMGATTSVFSVVYQVLLKPLPYPEPEQLVRLYQSKPQRERIGVSYASLLAWRERAHSFQALEGMSYWNHVLTGEGDAENLSVARATPGLLPMWPTTSSGS
jgi:hypothetical protein